MCSPKAPESQTFRRRRCGVRSADRRQSAAAQGRKVSTGAKWSRPRALRQRRPDIRFPSGWKRRCAATDERSGNRKKAVRAVGSRARYLGPEAGITAAVGEELRSEATAPKPHRDFRRKLGGPMLVMRQFTAV